jgi:RNA 2',3'-cyclic 3'-phosphodiesterase
MKRCFLAVKIPTEVNYQEKLMELKDNTHSKITLVNPELYHLTVHFFGEISNDVIENVISELKTLEFKEFELKLKYPGVLPKNNIKKVKVLYVDIIEGLTELQELHNKINEKLIRLKLPISNREFLPHLTVARVRFTSKAEKVRELWLSNEFDEFKVSLNKLYFVHSVLTPNGPIHSTLHEFDAVKTNK